jgi:hypothetical protein
MLTQSLLHPSAAAACQCGEPQAHDGEFLGTVVRVVDIPSNSANYPAPSHKLIFQVLNAWSGIDTSYVVVWTGTGFGDCGASFSEGVTYLVNINRYDTTPGWSTNICSGISQIALIGKPTLPYDQSYADVISQKGEGVVLRPISMDAVVLASESLMDGITLLSLLTWGVLLVTIGLAVRAVYRVYHREPKF